MARFIKLSEGLIEKALNEFKAAIQKGSAFGGAFKYEHKMEPVKDARALITLSEKAWMKTQLLVAECSKEVAWHGIVSRQEDKDCKRFLIEDIEVYPQVVTGATVDTDQEEYVSWLAEHSDEDFAKIRMQGHSHVNMGVTPSGVDNGFYEDVINSLKDGFYIFMIFNKSKKIWANIYDLDNNIMFEDQDITVEYLDERLGYVQILDDIKDKVKTTTVTTTASANTAKGGKKGTFKNNNSGNWSKGLQDTNQNSPYYWGGYDW